MVFLLAFLFIAQDYGHRGFLESRLTLYPQEAPNDPARTVGESLFRYEAFAKPVDDLEIAGGIDVRIDTHLQVDRKLDVSWRDRQIRRPIVAVRNFRALYSRSGLTVEAGKQFVRWGKTDIVTPTDRFAPRDFATVLDNELLGVTAVRATYQRGSETLDVVWAPYFTPSRIPLPDQRWLNAPQLVGIQKNINFPDGEEFGVRYSHIAAVEFAASFYQGFNHAPSFRSGGTGRRIEQFYPELQMFGLDIAIPLRWLTLKSEAGFFHPPNDDADEYIQYVIQLERQAGEWSFIGGYAGEFVADEEESIASFDPDRGLTQTVVARTSYNIDANRSVSAVAAIRDTGRGAWTKFEYSQALGSHWRLSAGLTAILGRSTDFLGQYRRNSNAQIVLRYSF